MKRFQPYLIGALGGALAIIFLPLTGLLNLSAVPPQSFIADWLGYMSARQSASLRSAETIPPDLDDPAMVRRGAGHYEMVCADCHGSPAKGPEQFARNLSPRPPLLMDRADQWRPPARNFWTVKHGIRRTAMPGWPTQMRDDEVWDMVAFLEVMPDMRPEDYAALGSGEADNSCARCHGENGESMGAGLPRLDIQTPAYLQATLKAFRDGDRQSGTMIAAARNLTDAQIIALAQEYGREVPVTPAGSATAADIARRGVPEFDVPSCDSCHGANAREQYPRLAGQDPDYIARQLILFAEMGVERGGPHAQVMAKAVGGLTPEQITDLATYYGGTEPTIAVEIEEH